MAEPPSEVAAKAALAEHEAEALEKEEEAEKLHEYESNREHAAADKASEIEAAMEASGGEVPKDMLDSMPSEEVKDVVRAADAEAAKKRAAVERERREVCL